MLWVSLGGHFVEAWYLAWLRPRLPATRAMQTAARLVVWFAGGVVLLQAMIATAATMRTFDRARRPAWWVGGLAFIGIELVAHLFLRLRGQPSFYDGRGWRDTIFTRRSMLNEETIDAYIATFPPKVRKRLTEMRRTIRAHAPLATERIAYRIPTFYLNGNLVHFAAFEHHVGFYPGAAGIAEFKDALGAYKSAKGSVQFPHDEPLPLDLVAEIVDFRVAQNAGKKARARRSV